MSTVRFILRFLALTLLLAAAVAGVIVVADLSDWNMAALDDAAQFRRGATLAYAIFTAVGGVAAALVIFVIDLFVGLWSAAGRRSALGLNVIVQVLLALTLLIGANVYSFLHYERWDLSREHSFTINSDVAGELRKLRGETTVIVQQKHKAGGEAGRDDEYDPKAEAKVIEKVSDLVDQLREFGPQFRVVVLDVNDKKYRRKYAEEVARFPGLEAAMEVAPENSIFFCDGTHIQRMGFSEFYRLDRTASRSADGGRGNLVLLNQGIEPFARRVLAIQEKKPRVGLLVSHPWLSSEGQVEEYTLAGLRKALTNYGFEVRDILTNKLVGRRGRGLRLEKAAMSIEESRFDRVEAQLTAVRLQIAQYKSDLGSGKKLLDLLRSNITDADLDRKLSEMYGQRVTMSAEMRAKNIDNLSQGIPDLERELARREEKEKSLEKDFETLQAQETVSEGLRNSDLKKKMAALLADCDVLVVARMTLIDTSIGDVVPNNLHQLDDNQLSAIKDYIKSGKPVLFCMGPTNEPPPEGSDLPDRKPTVPTDNLEALMAQVGFVFAPQAVLFDAEADAYATNQVLAFGRGAGGEEIPPLTFPTSEVPVGPLLDSSEKLKSNPLSISLNLVQRSAGQPLNLRIRYPRPLYFRSPRVNLDRAVSFLETARASWNEDQPYPTDDRPVPRFDPPKSGDSSRGTVNERRRGPFPVGVAVETTLPIEWYDEAYGAAKAAQYVGSALIVPGGLPSGLVVESLLPAESLVTDSARKAPKFVEPKKARLAAIGHGGWFSGPTVGPASEALILSTLNWLLGRDDRLPRADKPWQYPRAELTSREKVWWTGGLGVVLPLVFAWLGAIVVMVRKRR